MNAEFLPPLQHLTNDSLRTVIRKAKLANERGASRDVYFELHEYVAELTYLQRVELVSVMQVGRGREKYSLMEWKNILGRQSPHGQFANYITDLISLAEYLEKGIEILRVTEPDFNSGCLLSAAGPEPLPPSRAAFSGAPNLSSALASGSVSTPSPDPGLTPIAAPLYTALAELPSPMAESAVAEDESMSPAIEWALKCGLRPYSGGS